MTLLVVGLAFAQLLSKAFAISHPGLGSLTARRVSAPPLPLLGSWFPHPESCALTPTCYKATSQEYQMVVLPMMKINSKY